MVKTKTIFACSNCGASTPRWQGKCPTCGEWNTLAQQEVMQTKSSSQKSLGQAGKPQLISHLKHEDFQRFDTGIAELNSVLGGGMVPGSMVLLGGDPGIGKSTLALQAAIFAQKHGKKVLYVSGEESAHQIKMRASRLEPNADVLVFPETNLETVMATLIAEQPDLAIIDSIQTMNSQEINGVVGGVSQIAYATNSLMRVAKEYNVAVLIIGHVTKEGMLAGPKTLEHMVDTVLYLEGERFTSLRLLRSNKNRFGSAGEVGVFQMDESGLVEVLNPSALFLEHKDTPLAGSCTTAILEGNKVLLLEVQALTNASTFGYPRRTTSGFDLNRLQLILAILQKTLKVNLSNQDVYINVAGGFKLDERAADLPVALALLSSMENKPLPSELVAFGELGLLGEVRGVSQSDKRIREVEKLGFKQVVLGGRKNDAGSKSKKVDVEYLKSVLELKKLFK
ncbi:MAG: DNA repair protein RadA [Candidatus Doudnabacteria bacterium]|nr:DNA repair protein RadA [Candidatus Doudnabacteria bacterium]